MTSSRKAIVQSMQADLNMYWYVMRSISDMKRSGVPPSAPEMTDALDELDVLRLHTDWSRLKSICAAVLAVSIPVEALARTLAAAL